MQNDLISRSALKNALEYWTHFPTHRGGKSVYDIIDEAPSVDAVQVEKLGKFGKLMMPYEGCSRGHVGRMGLPATLENEALSFGIITDVDGGRWVPVVEDVLHELIAKAKANDPESLRPKGRWVWKHRHRGGFHKYTGKDAFGETHMPTHWPGRKRV